MKKDFSIMSSWAIRYFIAFSVFFLFPLFVFLVARNYEDLASGIVVPDQSMFSSSDAGATSTEGVMPEESRVMTQVEADTLQSINDSLPGDWLSQQDSQYVLRMHPQNTFDEIYMGKKFGWGTWRAFSGMPTPNSADTSGVGSSTFAVSPTGSGDSSDGSVDYYLHRVQLDPDSDGQVYDYQIYQLTDSTLLLIRTDNGKILPFDRASTSASASVTIH